MKTFRLGSIATLAFLAAAASAALAQPQPQATPARPTITVTQEAVVTVAPDRGELDVAVVTQAPNAKDAADQNATRTRAAIDAIKRAAGGATVQTVGYSINPDYRYREGQAPVISGYTARNTVRVTTDNLAQIGPVIDAATRAGANEVQRLQYKLRDDTGASSRALDQAARGARAKAEALAKALGVRIVRVSQVTEAQPVEVRPVMMEAQMLKRDSAAPTPIESSSIDVRAVVTLTVEIAS